MLVLQMKQPPLLTPQPPLLHRLPLQLHHLLLLLLLSLLLDRDPEQRRSERSKFARRHPLLLLLHPLFLPNPLPPSLPLLRHPTRASRGSLRVRNRHRPGPQQAMMRMILQEVDCTVGKRSSSSSSSPWTSATYECPRCPHGPRASSADTRLSCWSCVTLVLQTAIL